MVKLRAEKIRNRCSRASHRSSSIPNGWNRIGVKWRDVDKRKGSVTRYWSNTIDGWQMLIWFTDLLVDRVSHYRLVGSEIKSFSRTHASKIRKMKRPRKTREWRKREVVNVMGHVFARTQHDRLCAVCVCVWFQFFRVSCLYLFVSVFRFQTNDQRLIVTIIIKILIKNNFGCKNKTLNLFSNN